MSSGSAHCPFAHLLLWTPVRNDILDVSVGIYVPDVVHRHVVNGLFIDHTYMGDSYWL